MQKMMFAIAASLAMLVATGGGAQATFSVTVVINGITQTGANAPVPTNAGAINGAAYNLSQSFGTITVAINSNATAGVGTFARMFTNTFSITNSSLGAPTNVVVTLSQDGFSFPGSATFASPVNVPVAFSSAGSYSPVVTSSATGLGSYTNNVSLPSFGANFANTGNAGVGGPAPYTITQSISLTGIPASSTFQSNIDSLVTTVTPLPATGLMAAVGFPLLGLAGAFRRRVLG